MKRSLKVLVFGENGKYPFVTGDDISRAIDPSLYKEEVSVINGNSEKNYFPEISASIRSGSSVDFLLWNKAEGKDFQKILNYKAEALGNVRIMSRI